MKLIITYVLPAHGVNQGLGAYSLGSEEVSLLSRSCQLVTHELIITYVLPADGWSQGLAAHSLGLIEVSLLIKSCQLVTHEADNYLCSSCGW